MLNKKLITKLSLFATADLVLTGSVLHALGQGEVSLGLGLSTSVLALSGLALGFNIVKDLRSLGFSGKSQAYNEGLSEGEEMGYLNGHIDGFNSGFNDGFDSGYNDGHTDGVDDGLRLAFGDDEQELPKPRMKAAMNEVFGLKKDKQDV